MRGKTLRYEVGGLTVEMTPAAARRWNTWETTRYDLDHSLVYIPEPGNQSRVISLRRACCERLEPAIFNQILGIPANRID